MKKQSEAGRPSSPGVPRRYLYFTAAVTGGAIMIIEILGAKMLSPYVGTSHFVWTAQIAVTLVALSLGYAAGGWLVDRSPRLTWIYGAILAAAAYLCVSVLVREQVAYACLRFQLALGSLLASTTLFFLPLALLAMVGPYLVRVLTVSVNTVGANMGRLTSISTLGSVVGTVATGYLLIPWLPNSTTMFLTAGLLMAVAAIYFLAWERKHLPPALVTAVVAAGVGLVGLAPRPRADAERMTVLFDGNSNFGLLQVLETKDGELRYYLNDLLTQNTYEPAEKRSSSLFTYMLHGLARAYTPQVQDVLCVGIGAGIVPSRFAREGARVEAVEINPGVLPLARRYFDFESERVKVFIGDGRQFVNQTTHLYDTIILDAFLGESPPSHLMTREAFQAFGRRLKPTGTLVINTFGDFDPRRDFLVCSLAKTLRAAFPSVRLHASGNGNVFFVASLRDQLELVNPIDLDAVTPWLRDVVRETVSSAPSANPDHGLVLTDDYNPADFYDAINREELRRRLAMSYRPD